MKDKRFFMVPTYRLRGPFTEYEVAVLFNQTQYPMEVIEGEKATDFIKGIAKGVEKDKNDDSN